VITDQWKADAFVAWFAASINHVGQKIQNCGSDEINKKNSHMVPCLTSTSGRSIKYTRSI